MLIDMLDCCSGLVVEMVEGLREDRVDRGHLGGCGGIRSASGRLSRGIGTQVQQQDDDDGGRGLARCNRSVFSSCVESMAQVGW